MGRQCCVSARAAGFAGLLSALALAGPGCVGGPEEISVIHEPLRVCASGATLDGIDVSHHEGEIDWDAVAGAGIAFAFIRVSDGFYEDREFDDNWAGARRVGILRGAYQFFRPGRDASDQADLLLRRMGTLEADDLPPVLDVEDDDGYSPSHIRAGIREWTDRVEAATGRVPIIYTGLYFWRDEVAGGAEFADHPLWIAQYGRTCPDIPDPWPVWAFWQTSESGRVPGIPDAVDTDLFDGDLDDLLALTGGAASCGDGRCSGGETHGSCPGDCPGFIGEPCRDGSQCASGLCLTEAEQGYPGGMCTEPCERYCPDLDGHPVTFCVSLEDRGGYCFSRRDADLFPDGGCREGYHAETVSRHAEPSVEREVCVPEDVEADDGWWGGWTAGSPSEEGAIEGEEVEGEDRDLASEEGGADDGDAPEPPSVASGSCSVARGGTPPPSWALLGLVLLLCRSGRARRRRCG